MKKRKKTKKKTNNITQHQGCKLIQLHEQIHHLKSKH
jgi:hypothetical protein